MNYKRTHFWPWLMEYTVFFFGPDGAPFLKWWQYPFSCRRMWMTIKYTEEIREQCRDVFEWGNLRRDLIAAAHRIVQARKK